MALTFLKGIIYKFQLQLCLEAVVNYHIQAIHANFYVKLIIII